MRKKYLGRAGKTVKTYSSKVIRVDDGALKGYAALINIIEVTAPFIVGEDTCIFDNGYRELNYLPDGEHWQLSALYDNNGKIIEWYVDITRENGVDEQGNPYCDDLYLDAALLPDGRLLILDEDELRDALDKGAITHGEFQMARDTLDSIIESKMLTTAYMGNLCDKLLSMF